MIPQEVLALRNATRVSDSAYAREGSRTSGGEGGLTGEAVRTSARIWPKSRGSIGPAAGCPFSSDPFRFCRLAEIFLIDKETGS